MLQRLEHAAPAREHQPASMFLLDAGHPYAAEIGRCGLLRKVEVCAPASRGQPTPQFVDPVLRRDEREHGRLTRWKRVEILNRLEVGQPGPELVFDEDSDVSRSCIVDREVRAHTLRIDPFAPDPPDIERLGPHQIDEPFGDLVGGIEEVVKRSRGCGLGLRDRRNDMRQDASAHDSLSSLRRRRHPRSVMHVSRRVAAMRRICSTAFAITSASATPVFSRIGMYSESWYERTSSIRFMIRSQSFSML